jgi:hypothetical protein
MTIEMWVTVDAMNDNTQPGRATRAVPPAFLTHGCDPLTDCGAAHAERKDLDSPGSLAQPHSREPV